MGPFKASGIDGLHAVFFQSQWDIVGTSVCDFVKDVFSNPSRINSVNQTLLVLILKVVNPETVKDLRPISLCNVIYKLVTKIIANRIKNFLSDLISPNQCSFIPGRHSSDNVIITQEVIHTMRNMKGKVGFMALKIDLEKAYDRVSWAFLQKTLLDVGLSFNFVNLIMSCVSSCDMRVIWNGGQSRFCLLEE